MIFFFISNIFFTIVKKYKTKATKLTDPLNVYIHTIILKHKKKDIV